MESVTAVPNTVNQAQQSAIHHGAGPMLVLAGPGSGKTFVVTHRIQALIEEHHADPSKILVITFTKAAAEEMEERFRRLSSQSRPVWFGTFHAFFYHILRQSYYPASVSILSEHDKREYVRTAIQQEMDARQAYSGDLAESFLAELARMKNRGCSLQQYEPSLCGKAIFEALYQALEKRKAIEGKIDFDDMQQHCYWLLKKNADILAKWQAAFDYLMVDEYQDINEIQYRIVRMLAAGSRNLFVVGDDDQSIYGFRGAKPDMMRRFIRDYPECLQTILDINYRSRREITDAAGKVIRQNQERIDKEVTAASGEGGRVRLLSFEDAAGEESFLIKELAAWKEDGKLHENAVIFRTNRAMSEFAGRLVQADIPFSMKEKAGSIFRHFIAQDMLAYLEFAAGSHKRGLFYRIMNRPYRGIPRSLAVGPEVEPEELLSRCIAQKESRFLCNSLRKLSQDLSRIGNMQPYAALQYIRKGIGYEGYLQKQAEGAAGGCCPPQGMGGQGGSLARGMGGREGSLARGMGGQGGGPARDMSGQRGGPARGMSGQRGGPAQGQPQLCTEYMEVLESLQECAKGMRSLEEWKSFIKRYEESLEQGRKVKQTDGDALHLMTMHGAKGLEFDRVYLPRLNEGVMPHKKSTGAGQAEEECRMLYVGMTRAKEELCMSFLTGNKEKPEQMSRFLKALQ